MNSNAIISIMKRLSAPTSHVCICIYRNRNQEKWYISVDELLKDLEQIYQDPIKYKPESKAYRNLNSPQTKESKRRKESSSTAIEYQSVWSLRSEQAVK